MIDKPIPILFTIPNFITAGSGRVMMNIVQRLDRRKFAPAVCVSRKGGQIDREVEQMGIPFIEAPFTIPVKPYFSLMTRAKNAARVFKSYGFSIWHSWHYIDDYSEALIARYAGVENWVYTKKNMSWGSNGWLFRSLLARRIAVDNTDMADAFYARYGLRRKIHYIPHGIPTDQFSPDVSPSLGLRKKLGIPSAATVVGCVANLTMRKGHHVLLEAISRLPGVYLITIGKPMEEDYITRLEKMRTDLHIEDRAFLLGHVDDVPAFLSEIDIFVLPTWNRGSREGCPVALIEAMSSGKACIATDIPGSHDIIEEGKNGFLVPAEDANTLAEKINTLVHDSILRQKFQNAARERVISNFSIENEVRRYETLYQEMMT